MHRHRLRPGGGRDPDGRAHVPQVPGRVQEHHRPGAGRGQQPGQVDRRATSDGRNTRGRRRRTQRGERVGVDSPRLPYELVPHVGGQALGQLRGRGGVHRHDLHQLRAEPQRVLDRVEALEHNQRRVAARCPEARRDVAAHQPARPRRALCMLR